MTSPIRNVAASAFRALAAVLVLAGLAACGGGVSAPQNVPNQNTIVILPASTAESPVVTYSGLPTTFSITGGNGSYIVTSNNQAVLPSPGAVSGSSFTVVPNPVLADTTVTLTARDTGTSPAVAASVRVRASTITNEIQIIPTSGSGLSCSPAICSGDDAQVTVTLAQGGSPLPARGVRFEVSSGDYRFIVTSPTGVETLETTATVATDEAGRARARLRVNAGAANQTALLRVVDLGTSAFQQTSFVIAQVGATDPSTGYFAIPQGVTFTGPRVDQCARGVSSSFYVYGGRPPYTVANTGSAAFTVSPTVVGASGGSFTVTAQGGCVDPGLPIGITDAAGRTITVTVGNQVGTAAIPEFVVAPETISLSDCDTVASFTVAGGTGTYLQPSSGSGGVIATLFGNTVSVRRLNPSGPVSSPVSIGVSDGVSVKSVTLNLTGRALGSCPSSSLSVSPASVTLSDCTSAFSVAISGGAGAPYSVTSSPAGVDATVSGATVTIKRTSGSASSAGGTVTVVDSTGASAAIAVITTGAGAGACSASSLTANPASVTLSDCTTARQVTLSGGTGSYSTQVSDPAAISANIAGTTLSIQRAVPSSGFSGGTVTVTDSAGARVVVAVAATGLGSGACTSSAPLSANPTSVSLPDCTTSRTVTLTGGSGSYSVQADSASLSANIAGTTVTIQRANPSAAFGGGTVTIRDGVSAPVVISVSATGAGSGSCPATTPLDVQPRVVGTLDCTTIQNVTVSGGSGTYSAFPGNASVEATVSGNIVSIRRKRPSEAPGVVSTAVTVSDGVSSPLSVTVPLVNIACPAPA